MLKLHGSLRWRLIQEPSGWQGTGEISDWKRFDEARVENPGLDIVKNEPGILIGTHNKIIGYTKPLFWHLSTKFRLSLERASRLVVVGYGFSDKGINEIIIDWLVDDAKRRMVVVDPAVSKTKTNCRPAIQHHWERWRKLGQLVEVPSPFKAVTWKEIKGCF